MEKSINVTGIFRELSINEIMKMDAKGLGTAVIGAVGGACVGGVAGLGAGYVLTPVVGPMAVPACAGLGTAGGACVGFVEGW